MGTVSLITLTPGTPENVADVQTNFDNVASVLNGGVDAANVTDGSITQTELAAGASGLARGAFHASNNDNTYALAAAGVATKVKINTVEFDASGWFDVAQYRYKPLVAGYYRLSAYIGLLDNLAANEFFAVYIRKNASDHRQLFLDYATTTATLGGGGSCVVQANGTIDYFEVFALTTDAGTRRLATGVNCWFSGEMIGKS